MELHLLLLPGPQRLEHSIGMDTTASALSITGLVQAEYDDAEKVFSITAAGETIIAAKLEVGTAQTLARQEGDQWTLNNPPPNRTLELAKCQRYFINLRPESYDDAFLVNDGIGISSASRVVNLYAPLPVTMRVKPTVSYTVEWKITPTGGWAEGVAISSMVVNTLASNLLSFYVYIPSEVTIDKKYYLITLSGSLCFDANL